jgi:hypothetical protein
MKHAAMILIPASTSIEFKQTSRYLFAMEQSSPPSPDLHLGLAGLGAFIVLVMLFGFANLGDLLAQSPVAGGLLRYALISLCALLPTLVALVVGRVILQKIGPKLMGMERLVMAASIGFGVVALFTLLTGWLIGLSQYLFLLVTITVCVLGYRVLIECWADLTAAFRREHQSRIYMLAILFILLLAYFSCFVPPMDYDVLEYHLGAPAYWLREGRIGFIEHIVYSNFPFNTEMLYLFPMVLAGDAPIGAFAAKLINFQLGILCILAIGIAARRFSGDTAGWVAALAFAFNPWFMRSVVRAYDTLALSLYTLLSVYCLIQYLSEDEGESRRWCLLGSVFVGLAMGTKYPSFLFVWVPAVVLVGMVSVQRKREENWQKNGGQKDEEGEDRRQKDEEGEDKRHKHEGQKEEGRISGTWLGRAMPELLMIGFIPLAIAAPWLIKNLVYTQNPVFPLLGGLFGGPEWDVTRNARFVAAHQAHPVGPVGFIGEAWKQYVAGIGSSPLLFLFLPLVLKSARENRKACLTLAGYAALYLVMWVYFTHRIDRFLVPSFPALCVLCGIGFSMSVGWMRYGCRVILVFLCCLHGFHALIVSAEIGSWSMNVLDGDAPAVLKEKQGQAFEALMYMNEHIKPDEKVLFVGEAQTFYCSRNYFRVATVFDAQWMDLAFEGTGNEASKEDISKGIQKLKDAGITHIYVHWFESYRLQSSYAYRRDGELQKGYLNCLPSTTTHQVPERARFSHFHASAYGPEGLFHASLLGRNLELVEDFGEKVEGRPPLFPLYRIR